MFPKFLKVWGVLGLGFFDVFFTFGGFVLGVLGWLLLGAAAACWLLLLLLPAG